jgi:hypothetical protein
VSEKLTWKALDEAGEARTAANRRLLFRKRRPLRGKHSFGLAIFLMNGLILGTGAEKGDSG